MAHTMFKTDRAREERQTELRGKLENITTEIEALADKDTLSPGEDERYTRLRRGWVAAMNELELLEDEQREVDRVREQAVNAGRPGSNLIAVPGAPGGGDEYRRTSDGVHRDQALRFIEMAERRGEIPTHSADKVDRLLRTGTTGEQTLTAKWAEAAGDPDYLRAWSKVLHDPARGHLRFSGQEAEAWRRAAAVGDELRAMSTGDTAGQEMIPLSLDPAILLTNDGSANPIRANARVTQTASNMHRVVTSAGATAEWKTQAAEAADGSPVLAEVDIPLFLADCNVVFSYELAWSTQDLVGELQPVIIDAVTQLENTAFTTGSGTGQPQGLVTGLVGTASEINSSGTEAFVKADVYALQNALPARFSPNAAWYGHISILNAARQFETTNGAKEHPGLFDIPPSMLSRRFWELSNMDSTIVTTATASNYVLLYGDLSQCYHVVDRIGSFMELTTKLGAAGRPTAQRNLTLYRMTGAKVVRPQAARILDVPTTA